MLEEVFFHQGQAFLTQWNPDVGIEIDGVFDVVDKHFLLLELVCDLSSSNDFSKFLLRCGPVVHAMHHYFLGEEPWFPTFRGFIPFSIPLCQSPCSGSLQISFQACCLPHRSQPSTSESGVLMVFQLLWCLPSLSIF